MIRDQFNQESHVYSLQTFLQHHLILAIIGILRISTLECIIQACVDLVPYFQTGTQVEGSLMAQLCLLHKDAPTSSTSYSLLSP